MTESLDIKIFSDTVCAHCSCKQEYESKAIHSIDNVGRVVNQDER